MTAGGEGDASRTSMSVRHAHPLRERPGERTGLDRSDLRTVEAGSRVATTVEGVVGVPEQVDVRGEGIVRDVRGGQGTLWHGKRSLRPRDSDRSQMSTGELEVSSPVAVKRGRQQGSAKAEQQRLRQVESGTSGGLVGRGRERGYTDGKNDSGSEGIKSEGVKSDE